MSSSRVHASVRSLCLLGDAFLWINSTLVDVQRPVSRSEKVAALVVVFFTFPVWSFLLTFHILREATWRPPSRPRLDADLSADEAREEKKERKVMTYNLQSCIGGKDGRTDVERVCREVAHHRCDILLLQEVTSSQVETISRLCQYPHASFLPSHSRDESGVAVLSKLPFDEGHSSLPMLLPIWKGRERRASLFCRIEGVWYGSAHLQNDYLGLENSEQAAELLAHAPRPFLLGMDTNLTRPSFVPLSSSLGVEDLCLRVGKTYPSSPFPVFRLDTIVSSFLSAEEVTSSSGDVGLDPGSDHLPVTVSFHL